MKIAAIDDDQVALSVLTWILEKGGHQVVARTNPAQAMRDIQDDIDLVISDVSMPGLDGFEVARLVNERFGQTPPRTLLISGENHVERLDRTPPNQIIGMVEKPISLGHMHRVIRLIGLTRQVCPGTLNTSCPAREAAAKRGDLMSQSWSPLCLSASYSRCPHYNGDAGKAMRAAVKMPFPAAAPGPA